MNTTSLPPRPKRVERDAAREAVTEASTRACDAMRRAAGAREALKAAESLEEQEKRDLRAAQAAEERLKHIDRLHTLPAELVEVLARAARREVLTLSDEEWLPFIRRRLVTRTHGFRVRITWTSDGSTLIAILRAHLEKETPCPTTP